MNYFIIFNIIVCLFFGYLGFFVTPYDWLNVLYGWFCGLAMSFFIVSFIFVFLLVKLGESELMNDRIVGNIIFCLFFGYFGFFSKDYDWTNVLLGMLSGATFVSTVTLISINKLVR
jgi:hypothetical protein